MKDLNSLMKQAQGLQAKMAEAQVQVAQTVNEGQAGGGLVKLRLSGEGVLISLSIDDSLMVPGDAETVQDLVVAAHADAQSRLNLAKEQIMKEAMGPLAGLAGMPGFPGLK